MPVFKEDQESKRVIFNVELGLATRLEKAKESAKELGKKLDVDNAVNKALEKFLAKAEKHIAELSATKENLSTFRISTGPLPPEQITGYGQEPEDKEQDTVTQSGATNVTDRSSESDMRDKTDRAAKVSPATNSSAKTPAEKAKSAASKARQAKGAAATNRPTTRAASPGKTKTTYSSGGRS